MKTCTVCHRHVKARDLYYRLPAICTRCAELDAARHKADILRYVTHPLADHPVAVYRTPEPDRHGWVRLTASQLQRFLNGCDAAVSIEAVGSRLYELRIDPDNFEAGYEIRRLED